MNCLESSAFAPQMVHKIMSLRTNCACCVMYITGFEGNLEPNEFKNRVWGEGLQAFAVALRSLAADGSLALSIRQRVNI
jgi:hypothetical protein